MMADQCEFGLRSRDKWGEAPAKKPTRFLTNAEHVGEALAVRCQNQTRELKDQHRHVQLVQNRAKQAQIYPQKLCEAIVHGMKRQMESDDWNIVKVKLDSVQEKPPKHDEDDEGDNMGDSGHVMT